MSKTYVNEAHRKWLHANYANHSNEELLDKFNEMLCSDNEREIERLERQLMEAPNPTTRKRIEKSLEWRKAFKPLTLDGFGRLARRFGCPRKDVRVISRISRNKALATNIKKWEKEAQEVREPYAWLRSFRTNEYRIVRVSSERDRRRYSDAVTTYNRTESLRTGLTFATEKIKGTSLLRVVAYPSDSL